MKQISELPTTGQFVAVWENKHGTWGMTYKWFDGKLMEYNDMTEGFTFPGGFPGDKTIVTYFIAGD